MKSVAIIIPCRNEEQYIGKCIDSILAQDYPADKISVFVCDGMSIDQTVSVVQTYCEKYPQIHLLINEKKHTPFALNLGIQHSKSDFITILGAHSELAYDFVSSTMEVFNEHPEIGCAGGVVENIFINKASALIGKAMSSGFGVGNAHFRTGNKEGFVDTVGFGTYKREVFENIGYFDEELIRNQDDEFNFRMTKNGYKIYLSKKIHFKYHVRSSLNKLYRQYFQYGYWKVYVNKKHQTITTLRQLVPLFFVVYLFTSLMLAFFNLFIFNTLIAGLSVYVISSMYFAYRKSDQFIQVPSIMWTFFILHFSYGTGFLKGIIDFFIFHKKIKTQEKITR